MVNVCGRLPHLSRLFEARVPITVAAGLELCMGTSSGLRSSLLISRWRHLAAARLLPVVVFVLVGLGLQSLLQCHRHCWLMEMFVPLSPVFWPAPSDWFSSSSATLGYWTIGLCRSSWGVTGIPETTSVPTVWGLHTVIRILCFSIALAASIVSLMGLGLPPYRAWSTLPPHMNLTSQGGGTIPLYSSAGCGPASYR